MGLPARDKLWIPDTIEHKIARLDHGPLSNIEFVVIHINDGTTPGTLAWWDKAGHEADGAHVQVSKDGHCYQTLALNRKAWHAGIVNDRAIGFEHEGFSRAESAHRQDSRPHVQLHASADRLGWVHHAAGLGRPRFLKTVFPHGHGGAAWGGHPLCPGPWPWDEYMALAQHAYDHHWPTHA